MRRMEIRVLVIIAAILLLSGAGVWMLVRSYVAADAPMENAGDGTGVTREVSYMCEADPRLRANAIRECAMPVPCASTETSAKDKPTSSRDATPNQSPLTVERSRCVQPTDTCLAHLQPDIRRVGGLPADTFIAVLKQQQDDENVWQVTTTRPSTNEVNAYVYEPCGDGGRGALRVSATGGQPDRSARGRTPQAIP